MKRKFFSTLLMGAFFIASMSMFTSCKDYDDDINANKSDIEALQTQLKTLETSLTTAQSSATTAAAAAAVAQQTADKAVAAAAAAQTSADKATTAAAAAQAVADNALKLSQAAATQTEFDALSSTVNNLKTLIADVQNNKVDKDVYEAKVKEIAGQIEAINTSLNTLQNDLTGVKASLSDETVARTAAVTDLQNQINTLDAYAKSVKADLTAQITSLKTYVDGADASLLAGITANGQSITTLTTNLGKLTETVANLTSALGTAQNDIKTNTASISELRSKMDAAEKLISGLQTTVKGLQSQIDVLNVFIDKLLRGLVFRPDFYYGGIEAMEATTVDYTSVELNNDSKGDNPSASGETWKEGTASSVSPLVEACYHMNPSYFDIKNIKSISFVSGDKDYTPIGGTRAAGLNPTAKSFTSENGILKVVLNLDASKIESGDSKVTVLALQAHLNNGGVDSTVTSDYAALAKSTVNNIRIADAKANVNPWSDCAANEHFHVYTTAKLAIDNSFTHTLVYNDMSGIDLDTLVEAHFTRNGAKDGAKETKADDVKKYGMRWEFAPSHYISGSNKTSESVHVFVKGSKIRAAMPNAAGTEADSSVVQNKAEINREPMVRVVLRDTVNNKVVSVGFIKFKIVEKAQEETNPAPKEITFGNAEGVQLNCTGYNRSLTWIEIENQVLAILNNGEGMSKENFEASYDLQNSDNTCTLYTKKGDKWVTTDATQTVTNVPNDEAYHTSVLKWAVTGNDLYKAVYDNGTYKSGVSLSATVLFKSKNPAVNPDIYVTFNTGTISTPTATWGTTSKIANNWAANNGTLGSGFAEIHNNVEVVGQTNANDEYNNDILATLVRNEISLSSITGSKDFQSDLSYKFAFAPTQNYATQVGQSGTSYKITASADGMTLNATSGETTQAIAQISTHAGDVTSYQNMLSVVSYLKTDFAEDLLNAVSHENLAKTVTATIALKAENKCGFILPIKDNTFDIKFLRPVNAKGADGKTVNDAQDGGNLVDIYDLVNFKDWREQWISETYYAYYGITSITADTQNITTTLNGGKLGETLLSSVSNLVKFSQIAGGTKDYGQLKYENNGQVTSTFVIRVPMTVVYDWGKLTTATVDITVAGTTQNKAKKY